MKLKESYVYSDPQHRYKLAISKIKGLKPTLLDVGGYKSREKLVHKLNDSLKYESLNIGAAWYSDEEPHHIYNGHSIPFKDKTFNSVICVDTFEHIAKSDRYELINEMVRVANQRVVVVTPFCDDNKPMEAIFQVYADKWGIELKSSLKEHLKYGLPTSLELQKYAQNYKFSLSFATPKKLFWDMLIAQLINNAVLGDKAIDLNKKIQSLMEKMLESTYDDLSKNLAYRAVLSIDL